MIADDKYFCHIKDNLPEKIQMQLSKKPKFSFHFIIAFLKFIF